MSNIVQKHLEMVNRLAKPGTVILSTLNPFDCDFIHMGGCLMGESSELYEALRLVADPLEELGDFQFYWAKVADILGIEREEKAASPSNDPMDVATRLMVLGGDFWDVVKRAVIYRKPLERDRAILIMREIEQHLLWMGDEFSYSLDEVLEANYKKLADKDTGRYASGNYSDEQAIARKDKAGQ
jgi:hypothetical protein